MNRPWKVGDVLRVKKLCDCGCMKGLENGDTCTIVRLNLEGNLITHLKYHSREKITEFFWINPSPKHFELVSKTTKRDCM